MCFDKAHCLLSRDTAYCFRAMLLSIRAGIAVFHDAAGFIQYFIQKLCGFLLRAAGNLFIALLQHCPNFFLTSLFLCDFFLAFQNQLVALGLYRALVAFHMETAFRIGGIRHGAD